MEQISYSQTTGNPSFDWNALLQTSYMDMTYEEISEASRLAHSWVTCAVGQQCAIIPRNMYDGEPVDMDLAILGIEFYEHIDAMQNDIRRCTASSYEYNRSQAIATLHAIEARSAILIAQIKGEGK